VEETSAVGAVFPILSVITAIIAGIGIPLFLYLVKRTTTAYEMVVDLERKVVKKDDAALLIQNHCLLQQKAYLGSFSTAQQDIALVKQSNTNAMERFSELEARVGEMTAAFNKLNRTLLTVMEGGRAPDTGDR